MRRSLSATDPASEVSEVRRVPSRSADLQVMRSPTYFLQGTHPREGGSTNRRGASHSLHVEGQIIDGREGRDGLHALAALVPHPHGRTQTLALTRSSESGRGRHTVDPNGAPVTTPSNDRTISSAAPARLTMRGLYARAGLPVPIYDKKPSQTHDSRAWDSKIGSLTHLVAGRLAPAAQTLPLPALRALINETVGATVRDRALGRLDRARMRVTGMAVQYLTQFVPATPTTFIGAEVAAGRGRIDLAWVHPTAGVFFDEIKTWRHIQVSLDEDTWEQVHRYLDHGCETFGDRFAGVRVITLSNLRSCQWISPDGLIENLASSPLHPEALTRQVAA